jgi:hypothetical protein
MPGKKLAAAGLCKDFIRPEVAVEGEFRDAPVAVAVAERRN